MTLRIPIKGLAKGSLTLFGSVGKTSSAALDRCPEASAACSASISPTVPRDAVISLEPGFMAAMACATMMLLVDLPPGTRKVTISAKSVEHAVGEGGVIE